MMGGVIMVVHGYGNKSQLICLEGLRQPEHFQGLGVQYNNTKDEQLYWNQSFWLRSQKCCQKAVYENMKEKVNKASFNLQV